MSSFQANARPYLGHPGLYALDVGTSDYVTSEDILPAAAQSYWESSVEKCIFLQSVSPIDSGDTVTLMEVTVFIPQQHVHLGACSDLKVKKPFLEKFSQCKTDTGTLGTQLTFSSHGSEMLNRALQLLPCIFYLLFTKRTLLKF